ncbi:radical SAM family heme chaperone HemW [Winogradskya humida]|uniref:radical SAM family heme chaperone HemW n=1 Tax=Winogradskya humida TaxID=113566 RepID=UPI0019445674|nr:radical SAM family heme chaperone HemW [Actinoplanes humidus]
MPGALPDGEPVPSDGSLPDSVRVSDQFGVYVHVPFCASRCGYCDFNTYTARELGGGASQAEYASTVLTEVRFAGKIVTRQPVQTVFVGGGTPTLLSAEDLGRILEGIDETWGIATGAEITTEANPETVSPAYLEKLRSVGFNRISLGMQSASAGVLRILERNHTPGRAIQAATEAREAGFEHVNLDLIYGTPGETADDFAASLDAVIGAGVDHVSAYSLIVEDGTRIAARMRRGELEYPSDDVAADRYLTADRALTGAGFEWYEVSNWATSPEAQCRHNRLYWTGGDWWGFGPGAHSHVGGVRWWNVKHPSAYAQRLAEGVSPGLAREILTPDDRRVEEVMLGLRLKDGLPLAGLDPVGVEKALANGLLEPSVPGRAVLTLQGRLLADAVVRDLLP